MFCGTMFGFLFLLLLPKICAVEVKVKQGSVIGTRRTTMFSGRVYYAFYRVPYAKPPVGRLRFKDPVPVKEYDKPIDATTEYYGSCAQAHIVHKHIFGSEDCLHINIFTPSHPNKQSNLKSIIVFVHGFAFTGSLSHLHGPDFLIERDVIFISVTHRISVFGFLKLNESDSHANMGLKDIIVALKWIRKNIAKFGGDKNKITLMGNDSGASFLSLLLITKANKLFSKMILQSGGLFSPSLFQTNSREEISILTSRLEKYGSKSIEKSTAKHIIAESLKIYSRKDWINFQKAIVPFSPVIEMKSNKSLLTVNPHLAKLNLFNKEIMIGFNSQESIAEIIPFLHNPKYLKTYHSFFKFMVPFGSECSYKYSSKTYGEIASKIQSKYFRKKLNESTIEQFARYVTDLHKYPVYKFIKQLVEKSTADVYAYIFNYIGRFNAVRLNSLAGASAKVRGAAKGDELSYLTRFEPFGDAYVVLKNDSNNRDRKLIEEMARMWANFAQSGNPTPKPFCGNVTWLPMTTNQNNALMISASSRMVGFTAEEKMYSFWNNIYKEFYSQKKCSEHKHDEL